MATDFISDIIDWKEMPIGSIHAKWDANNALDGKIIVEASDVPIDDWFDEIQICEINNEYVMSDDGTRGKKKTKMFNLGVIGYRYSRVKFSHGTNTAGTISIVALGKKNG